MSNLQNLRKAAGLSQRQLADKSETSFRTLQDYEQGNKDINKAQVIILYKIAKTLQCSIEDLMELE